MKSDEKICPKCAETVKKAAVVCKHCGYQFSAEELDAARKKESATSGQTAVGCIAIVILVLLVGTCVGGDDASTDDSPASSESSAPEEENAYADTSKQVAWIEVGKDAIRSRLKDPESAEFRNVHFFSGGTAPVACGEVNARNSFGGYTGFEPFIAAGTEIAVTASDMESSAEMTKLWNELCVRAPHDKI